MTKPMQSGSINKNIPSWREFNLLLQTIDLDDSKGHLFVADVFFTIKSQPKNKRYTIKYIRP